MNAHWFNTAFTATAVGQLISLLATFTLYVMGARLLRPADFATLALVLSLVAVCVMVAQVGLHRTIVREAALLVALGGPTSARSLLTRALCIVTGSALALAILLAIPTTGHIVAAHIGERLMAVLPLASVLVIMRSADLILGEAHRGMGDVKRAALHAEALPRGLGVAVLIAVYAIGWSISLTTILLVLCAASGVNATISAIRLLTTGVRDNGLGVIPLKGKIPTDGVPLKTRGWRDLVSLSVPAWGISILIYLVGQFDIWAVAVLASQNNVALYGASSRLAALVVLPLTVASAVVAPVVAAAYGRGSLDELQRLLSGAAAVTSVVAMTMWTVYFLFADQLLLLFFGDPFYVDAKWLLIILATGRVIGVATGLSGLTLMMAGEQLRYLRLTAVSVAVGIALVCGGTSMWGARGAALGTASGILVQNIREASAVRRYFGVFAPVRLRHLREDIVGFMMELRKRTI